MPAQDADLHADSIRDAESAADLGGILIVWATITWMSVAVWRHYRWVAVAQVPYFLWVSIATVLQLSTTALNWGS